MKLNTLRVIFSVISILFITSIFAQQLSEGYTIIHYPAVPNEYSPLHKKLKETSGVIYFRKHIWTFNDSGGKPEIYKIDRETGKVIQTVIIENAENRDWEDITQDKKYIYIGDFGNNLGNRQDLKIYKIMKKPIALKKKTKVTSEIIEFSYNDQQSFDVKNRNHNFDCESMISFDDSLIIFTKNWEDGKTRMYKLPKAPGQYKLDYVSSYNVNGLATGADYNKDNNILVIIGYKDRQPFVFNFENFDGNTMDRGNIYRIEFPRIKNSQTEGISWFDKETIIFTSEKTTKFDQVAYKINIKEVLKQIDN